MGGRALFEYRVDQRQADGAAEIAHQVEQAARIRDMDGVEAAQCQGGARQQTQHHGGTADKLLPEQSPEIGLESHKAVADQANREQSITNGDQQPGVDAPFEERGNRRHHQLSGTGHHHDFADRQSLVISDQTKVYRQQKSCPVEAYAEDEAEAASDREIAIPERAKIDQWFRMAQRTPDDATAADYANTRQHQRFCAIPAAVRGFLENQLQTAEKDGKQRQSEKIDRAEAAPIRTIDIDGPSNQQRDDDPRRYIDQEQPMPRIAVRDEAADGWSEGWRQHCQQACNERCSDPPEPLEHQKNRRENERDQSAAAEALQHPRRDQ